MGGVWKIGRRKQACTATTVTASVYALKDYTFGYTIVFTCIKRPLHLL
jgi:hypothetical protein